ncbi:uncharacterized protein BCR38DRAFT_480367 [Pseudomassariella vexata]|uniref:Uncharacterized protein n=1 Tax=Pseudomassariella vexata TaxID=1141098 RepID=A0A1Y2EK17_9PEZI|nr:uncharacterized protein BCR38DRAFT_480367 [Pseudomassariella vexata]ORY71890.1 hypothetical protein BCR38DRAFT_480367 [Pseudomassariella vexata]
MCKQYYYLSLCSKPKCDAILGRKHRNRYCRSALDARRLGRCTDGVMVMNEFRHCETGPCRRCRTETGTEPRVESEKTVVLDGFGVSLAGPAARRRGSEVEVKRTRGAQTKASRSRKCAGSVFEFAFENALGREVEDFDKSQKKDLKRKRKGGSEMKRDNHDFDNAEERLMIVSPANSTFDLHEDRAVGEQWAGVSRERTVDNFYYGFESVAKDDRDSGYCAGSAESSVLCSQTPDICLKNPS